MENKILEIVSDILGVTANQTTVFSGVSSLKILQIIMALDEEGITLPLEKISKIKTMKDIFEFAEKDA